MAYKIEEGIPIPLQYRGGSKKKYPFDDMEIGDSFLVTCIKGKVKSVSASLIGSTRRVPHKSFTTRYIKEEKGVRIWRIS